MSSQPNPDINQQIDRILSSNIHRQLLSEIPLQLLQSPAIIKTERKYEPQSASSKRSENRQQIEEDLYEKAEQIFKLKQMLESELANINQIVMDNQKLTEVNGMLRAELKKIKNEWSEFRESIAEELKSKSHEIKIFQHQQLKMIKEMSDKSSIKPILQIQLNSITLALEPSKKSFSQNLSQTEMNSQIQQTVQNLQAEINRLNQTIKTLQEDNYSYRQQIKVLQTTKLEPSKNQPQPLKQKQLNQQSIDCYSSFFMKSMFQDEQIIDQIIRKALFNSQKSIFNQLQQAKYFGKIVSRTKNGNAIEQYKNGFQYEGKFFKNQRHGIGKLFYKNKLVYAGEWKNGKFEGKGVLHYYLNLNVQKIQTNFRNGSLEGYGTMSFSEGYKIRALFKNNAIESEGMIVLGENKNLLNFAKKSYIGKINFLKDKENMKGIDKLQFETHEGQFIEI